MTWMIVLLSTFLGGLLAQWLKNSRRFLEVAVPFSGAVLLSICLVHIIPDTVMELGHSTGMYILVGFLIQLLLEKYSHGIEHGHSHISKRFSRAVFWGLGLHAIIEGIPLGYNFRNPMVHDTFALAVVVHKIPEAFALGVFLLKDNKSKLSFYSNIFLFALITPLAAVMFGYLGERFLFFTKLFPYFVAIALGSFLWIATTIFFESEGKGHKLEGRKLWAIILGFALVIILDLVTHAH